MPRTHVDLFSGIGGFSLACEWAGVETIAFSEIDPYANRILQRHWPSVKNYGDVRGFPGLSAWLLTAGVPCQPSSQAGKQRGASDDRWLWPQTLAVVENGSYEWLLFENPTGILSLNDGLEFERICSALEGQGYEVQPLIVPACAVGAFHKRDRIWIVAHTSSRGQQGGIEGLRETFTQRHVAPSMYSGVLRSGRNGNHLPAPRICRGNNDVPNTVDRLRCLGNAIVPAVAFRLISAMLETENLIAEKEKP